MNLIPNIRITEITGEQNSLAREVAGLAKETSDWLDFAYWHVPGDGSGWPPEEGMRCGLVGRLSRLFARMSSAVNHYDFEAADIFARCAFESCSDLSQMLDDKTDDRIAFQTFRIGKTKQFRDVVLEHLKLANDLDDEEAERRERLLADSQIKVKQPSMNSLMRAKGLDPLERGMLWNLPSQAIHGTHENLGIYHLKIENDRCFPISSPGAQPLRPHVEIIGMGIRICWNYLAIQVQNPDNHCFQRLNELEDRLKLLMTSASSPRLQP